MIKSAMWINVADSQGSKVVFPHGYQHVPQKVDPTITRLTHGTGVMVLTSPLRLASAPLRALHMAWEAPGALGSSR